MKLAVRGDHERAMAARQVDQIKAIHHGMLSNVSRYSELLVLSVVSIAAMALASARRLYRALDAPDPAAAAPTATEQASVLGTKRKLSVTRSTAVQTPRALAIPEDVDRHAFHRGGCNADVWSTLCRRFGVASGTHIRFRVHDTEADGNCAFHAFIQSYTKRFTRSGKNDLRALRSFLRDYVTVNAQTPVVENFIQSDDQRDVCEYEKNWAGVETLALLAHAFNVILIVIEIDLAMPLVFAAPPLAGETVPDIMRRQVLFIAKAERHYRALEVVPSTAERREADGIGTADSDEEDVVDFPNHDVLSIMLQLADRESELWDTISATMNPEITSLEDPGAAPRAAIRVYDGNQSPFPAPRRAPVANRENGGGEGEDAAAQAHPDRDSDSEADTPGALEPISSFLDTIEEQWESQMPTDTDDADHTDTKTRTQPSPEGSPIAAVAPARFTGTTNSTAWR